MDICKNRHGGNQESAAANLTVNKEAMRLRILDLAKSKEDGITTDEVSEAFGLAPNRISGRLTELKKDGRLIVTAHRRVTRTGCKAAVLTVAA